MAVSRFSRRRACPEQAKGAGAHTVRRLPVRFPRGQKRKLNVPRTLCVRKCEPLRWISVPPLSSRKGFVGGAVPGETEVSSQWIRTLIENDDRTGAAAISIVLLLISFVVLFILRAVGSRAARREELAP